MINRILYSVILMWYLLLANTTFAYTRQDTLRGSNGIGRYWWDVLHYDLSVKIDTANRTLEGVNYITLRVNQIPTSDSLQLDLQEPMTLDFVEWNNQKINFIHDGNVWWIRHAFHNWQVDSIYTIYVEYHGKPVEARNPPWDGGFIWTKDSMGKPWIAVACQGLGASSWWPCKDAQWDEPDNGMNISIEVNKGMQIVSNGRKKSTEKESPDPGYDYSEWEVVNPINSYGATFYIGDYVGWHDTMMGEKGRLDLNYYALSYNEAKAHKQFSVVKPMLHCFENWMGPYPFYEDGYKIVEAPYLGMEHQSATAYGNAYKMGYMGRDRSNSGVGSLFDFIIVHESGHEWFGNSITAKDIADNWLHEGFTTYTEALFAECSFGKDKAFEYTKGEWANIKNDKPIIGNYGVNDDGSSDKYDKGSAVVHMLRMILNNDEAFRNLLRILNVEYYHKTVSSSEIERLMAYYINTGEHKLNVKPGTNKPIYKPNTFQKNYNFKPFFDQYLRTNKVPEIEWYIKDKELFFRFTNTVDGFTLPLRVNGGKRDEEIFPTNNWQNISWKKGGYNVTFSNDFLITSKP
jgi:aminopeptidase N